MPCFPLFLRLLPLPLFISSFLFVQKWSLSLPLPSIPAGEGGGGKKGWWLRCLADFFLASSPSELSPASPTAPPLFTRSRCRLSAAAVRDEEAPGVAAGEEVDAPCWTEKGQTRGTPKGSPIANANSAEKGREMVRMDEWVCIAVVAHEVRDGHDALGSAQQTLGVDGEGGGASGGGGGGASGGVGGNGLEDTGDDADSLGRAAGAEGGAAPAGAGFSEAGFSARRDLEFLSAEGERRLLGELRLCRGESLSRLCERLREWLCERLCEWLCRERDRRHEGDREWEWR